MVVKNYAIDYTSESQERITEDSVLYWSWRALAVLSGVIWMLAGVSLFNLGIKFLSQTEMVSDLYLFPFWVILCLYVGFLKGRFVLTKSANRIVTRLKMMTQPIPLWKIYSIPTWIILLSMVGVSQAMRVFEVSYFVRGSIDLAVGVALIKGSLTYFKQSIQMQDLRYL